MIWCRIGAPIHRVMYSTNWQNWQRQFGQMLPIRFIKRNNPNCIHNCHGVCNADSGWKCVDCVEDDHCFNTCTDNVCFCNAGTNDDCLTYSLVGHSFDKVCVVGQCTACTSHAQCVNQYALTTKHYCGGLPTALSTTPIGECGPSA